jgi:translocator protein
MMAVAAWLVWRRAGWARSRGLMGLFALQLALNLGWSAVFFGLRSPGLALLEIVLLWLAIAATAVGFWGRSTAAMILMLPYLAWTGFAAVLNLAIYWLNR